MSDKSDNRFENVNNAFKELENSIEDFTFFFKKMIGEEEEIKTSTTNELVGLSFATLWERTPDTLLCAAERIHSLRRDLEKIIYNK